MDTKENVRRQLQELSSDQITDIMCEFFTDGANSWQSDILWELMGDSDARCIAEGYMIDKIIAEVKVEDLVESGWIEHPLQDIIDEFKELKATIEAMPYNEVMENYCTLGESDHEVELDVSDDIGRIVAVYIDVNDYGEVSVSADHITVRGEDGQNEVVNLSKIIK